MLANLEVMKIVVFANLVIFSLQEMQKIHQIKSQSLPMSVKMVDFETLDSLILISRKI